MSTEKLSKEELAIYDTLEHSSKSNDDQLKQTPKEKKSDLEKVFDNMVDNVIDEQKTKKRQDQREINEIKYHIDMARLTEKHYRNLLWDKFHISY